jgi:hypothetical protein
MPKIASFIHSLVKKLFANLEEKSESFKNFICEFEGRKEGFKK